MTAMDSDVPSGASAEASDYSQLNDGQLGSAIRFAEKHLRWVEEDHVTLLQAYREEIDAMRRHLIDRMLRRMVTSSAPLSDEQQHDLSRAFERRGMDASEIRSRPRSFERPSGSRRCVDGDRGDGVASALGPRSVSARTAGQPGL